MTFAFGDPIRIETTKWGGGAHWIHPGRYLDTDDLGVWVGFPTGTHHSRPGLEFDSQVDSVSLIPHDDWCAMTFNAPGIGFDVYVDLATPAVWDSATVSLVDLDLDVIRRADGSIELDDEDEFEQHQVELAYPADVVARTRARAFSLLREVEDGAAPFDGRAQRFLEEVPDIGRPVLG